MIYQHGCMSLALSSIFSHLHSSFFFDRLIFFVIIQLGFQLSMRGIVQKMMIFFDIVFLICGRSKLKTMVADIKFGVECLIKLTHSMCI